MLEKLKLVYGNHIISTPTKDKHILWYETDEGEIFGVNKKELSTKEILLLNSFLTPIDISHTQKTEDEQKWYSFLFENKSLTIHEPVRVHYFKMDHQVEQRQQIKEAVNSSLEHTHFIWTGGETAMLIQTNASADNGQLDRLNDLSQAITSDFLTNSVFLQGQLHLPNEHVKMRLLNEHQLFLWHMQRGKLRSGVTTFYQCLPSFIRYDADIVSDAISDAFKETVFDRDVYRTLMTYMQCNFNASQAAKALYVHRNSLQYRIDKFIERTGLDIRHFQEAAAAYMMMNLLDLS
ncbi:transcriptional regulator [Bacillus xiamenensis]|uniref:Helix-turn-helix domain-containing protein n=1 Tax=Bacillus xiamenensis TaxID=1178537 RepID=A0AAC9IG88_9BACI|nr:MULTISPECIES: helix-turn-helix domain-containing protein [Bacillus]AOZ87824.1 transcriptional regulator [Bacillus xiamenensis]EKF34088.1 transcriptional regulator [Bacillus xiamenensis]MBG9912916.1 transcriptional regulator [Bacillus xiamenensis]MCW1838159.1 helix-turn-helix domain-containing protein [Bacillus xiamenensis]MCY9577216.1 helix-turn-helix domain-containing protein [Bacillus xiamenensis]